MNHHDLFNTFSRFIHAFSKNSFQAIRVFHETFYSIQSELSFTLPCFFRINLLKRNRLHDTIKADISL